MTNELIERVLNEVNQQALAGRISDFGIAGEAMDAIRALAPPQAQAETGYCLWDHPDLPPRVARPEEASFAVGDPKWVRCYPVEVCGSARTLTQGEPLATSPYLENSVADLHWHRGFNGLGGLYGADFNPEGKAAFAAGKAARLAGAQAPGEPPGWISVADKLPEERAREYIVATIAVKQYSGKSNYPGEGIRECNQDWVVRRWPENFTYWMPLPPTPGAAA